METEILKPMALLALYTAAIIIVVAVRRGMAMMAGTITLDDFAHGETPKVPASASLANRNYMNLLEMPVLYYAVCITIFALQRSDGLFVGLAWAYFGLRVAHSLIHLTYNKVLHRSLVFALSNFVLAIMWVRVLLIIW
mgnify:CR=1 FL=1